MLLRPPSLQGAVAARLTLARSLSSSSRRLYAQPTSNSTESVNSQSRAVLAEDVNPYKGQSALDKAVHLFFFTEIIRGVPCSQFRVPVLLNANTSHNRHVDRFGTVLPPSIHNHVSI